MTQYIEPTLRARLVFFLTVIMWAGLALLVSRLDQLLPPLSKDLFIASDQVLWRTLLAAVLSTLFFAALSLLAVYYTRRAVHTGQWPPAGMAVPFRIEVREIKKPRNAWIYLVALLGIFAIHVTLPWVLYSKQRAYFDEFRAFVGKDAQHMVKPGVPAAASRGQGRE